MVEEVDVIESKGYASFIYNLCKTFSFGAMTYSMYNTAGINTYISVIVGTILGLIPFGIFLVLRKLCGTGNIFDLNVQTFGKVIGTMLNFTINIVFVILSVVLIYNIVIFFNILFMPDTTIKYLMVLVLLPIVYASTKDLPTIGRISQILMGLTIIISLVSIIGLLDSTKVYNIFPILANGIKSPLKASIMYALYTSIPIFSALIVDGKYLKEDKKINRKLFFSYIFSNIMEFIIVFFTIIVLGEEVLKIYRYPEYIALKNFSLFNIIERVENALSLHFLYNMVIFLIFAFYSVKTNINKVVKNVKFERYYVYLLAIIIFFAIEIVFKNTIQATNMIEKYLVYILILGIGFPMLITFFCSGIKKIVQNFAGKNLKI